MKNKKRFLIEAIREFCNKKGILLTSYSQGWLLRMTHITKEHFVFGYDLGLNSSVSHQIAADKGATYEVLKAAKIPAIEHVIFHSASLADYVDISGNWKGIVAYFDKANHDVVCKPLLGTGGSDIIRARTMLELEDSIQRLLSKYRSICLSPYLDIIEEYRTIVLNGVCKIAFCKVRHRLLGDGTSTVLELIAAFCKNNNLTLKPDQLPVAMNSVVPAGETFLLEWRHNLALGATPVILETSDTRFADIAHLAEAAAQALHINFASVDLALTKTGLHVLEVNSGVMMEQLAQHSPEGRVIATSIYEDALTQLFF